jgi:hypothetical protein
LLAGRVLARDEPDVAHQLLGAGEPLEVADLGAQPDSGERVDAAQAPQAPDLHRSRRVGDHRDDPLLELLTAVRERVDRAARVEQPRLRCRPLQRHRGQPVAVALGPRGPPPSKRIP